MSGCEEQAPPQVRVETPIPVHTMKVEMVEKIETYKYAGEISPRNEFAQAFRIGGKVLAKTVEVGDVIKRGSEIARLDPKDLRLERESMNAEVEAAQAHNDLARADLERYRALQARNFISKAELDRRANTVNVTSANKNALKSRLYATQNQISYTILKSDIAGVVTAVEVESGEVVNPGQTIIKVARTNELEAVISIPENRLNELKQAKGVEISLWANPDKRYSGEVREVSPLADPATRTYRAKISIHQPDENISFGMTASVTLVGEAKHQIYVPLSALYHQANKVAVWVVDPVSLKVNLVPLEVSGFDSDRVAVSSGLNGGEYVVVKGIHKLYKGQKVRLIDNSKLAAENK